MNQQQRNTIIITLGALAAIGPFSIDMYLPGFPAIAADLETDIAHVGLSLTSYFIGISVGQIIYGPLIDRFGRKKPLSVGLLLYMAAAVGCALSPDVYWLIGLRLLLALGGCVGMVAGRAVVRDLFPPAETAKVFSSLILVMGVAPIIAPTLGGYVTAAFGWRYIFYLLAIIGGAMLLMISRLLPESKVPDPTVSLKPSKVFKEYMQVFKEPSFTSYALAGSISFAGMFAYISGSPFVFMEYFALSETLYGWLFGLNAFGFIAGSQLNRLWLKKRSPSYVALRTGFCLSVVGLLLAGGSLLGLLSATGTFVLIFSFLFFLGFLAPNTTALTLEPFTRYIGSASAMLGSLQMIAGALASAVVSSLHDGTPLPMALVMAGSACIALIALLVRRRSAKKEALAETRMAGAH
ncbi:multidrug effflux MFS transporter [Nafulsella turpanensis]|uniref:multidrug effflux MFS transporter n=1 Tax=Nafulsella turpanensis TaxID=1265690 RepID=UPI00058ABF37|nr:multidrug effflux MFS transporter [Nafulsella turpanensis]